MATPQFLEMEDSKCFNCGEVDATVLSFPPSVIDSLNQLFGRKLKNNLTTSEALQSKSICKLCNIQFRKLLVAYDTFNSRTHRSSRISSIGEAILSLDKEIMPSDSTKNDETSTLQIEYYEKFPRLRVQKLSDKLYPPVISTGKQMPINSYCKCSKCGRRFNTEYKLQKHKEVVHAENMYSHSCHLCGKTFINIWFYKNHVKASHRGIELTFSCVICKITFKSQSELTEHRSKSHRLTTHPFKCNHCDKAFKTVDEIKLLREHLVEFHPNTNEAVAAQSNMNEAKEMEERKNVKNFVYDCKFCSKPIGSKMDCFYHTQVMHYGMKSCPTCDKHISSGPELILHIKQSGHKLVKCCKCPKVSFSTQLLLKHMDVVHYPRKNYSFTCEVCGVPFAAKDQLRSHYNWHATIAGPSQFHCIECDKSYSLKHHLKIHMERVHNNETYKCDHCNKVFSSKHAVQKHTKIYHTKEKAAAETQNSEMKTETSALPSPIESKATVKRYRCDLCNMSFDRPGGLTLHCRWIHLTSNFRKSKVINNYAQHEKYMSFDENDPERKFGCKICNTRLKRSDHMFRHIFTLHGIKLRDHKDFEPTYCKLCDRTYPKVKYRKHLNVHKNHPNDTKLLHVRRKVLMKCNMCEAECLGCRLMQCHFIGYHPGTREAIASNKNKDQLIKQRARRKNKVSMDLVSENKCSKCKRLFPSIAEMKHHEITKHKINIKCLVCSKTFNKEADYKDHEDEDHKEYPCSYCGTVLYAAKDLHDHLEGEHLSLPFSCEFCWQTFMEWSKLIFHYRSHFSLDIKCQGCDKMFKNNKSIKKHMATCGKTNTLKLPQSSDKSNSQDASSATITDRPKRGATKVSSKKQYKKSKYLNSSDDSSESDNEFEESSKDSSPDSSSDSD